jgi:hypothetical protein
MRGITMTKTVLWSGLAFFSACLIGLAPVAFAGSISGQVTGGGAPVPYACLHAVDNHCQGTWYWAQADANGNYTLPGLPAGTYYVKTGASCAGPQFFVDEWWDGAEGTRDCNQAGPVGVAAEGDTPGINFALEPGGIVRGSVMSAVGPIGNVSIDLNGEPCGGYPPGGGLTDSAGNYTVTVPAGTYFVRANPFPSGLNYVMKYWNPAGGSINCWEAAPVMVTDGVISDGISFLLEPGGSVSGHVTDASGGDLSNVHVYAQTQGCGGEWLAGVNTDANGNYTLFGLPTGDVFVRACASCSGFNYVDEWYNNVTDCNQATPVAVVAGQDTPGIHFQLEPGGSVSGHVSDALGNPIPNVHVYSQSWACGGPWLAGTSTDVNGNYTLFGLPGGDVFVRACPSCTGQNYVDEWYDNVIDCSQATPVAVVAGQDTPNTNFALEEGGTISGWVRDDLGTGLSNVLVNAYGGKCHAQHLTGATTDLTGYYEIRGIPLGTQAYLGANLGHENPNFQYAWYDGNVGTIDCNAAVAVAAGSTDINFALQPGGSLSGHVSDALGNPIPNLNVFVQDAPCGGNWLGSANTDPNGNYTVFGLPAGNVYVATCANCTGLSYVDKWYNNVTDCNQATAVPIVVNQNTPGIDFSLESGGSVSGQVVDPWGNPVPFVPVSAFSGLCWVNWAGGAQTDQNGNYTISGLPFGDYYVVAQAKCHTPNHLLDQWWDGWTGTPDCNLAAPVNVAGATPGIDFFLAEGTPYPGPFFDRAEMFSIRNPDGSMGTVFYAFVGGPSPEDVCSFTVSGPAGTFDLQPVLSFRQLGLIYLRSLNFVVPDGMYTLWLTDTVGRSVSVTRNFVFNDAVPQIDPASMYPANMSYQSTTPILGADPPITVQDSVIPGPLQYQVMVRDYHSSAIWYASDYQDYPTFQVPEGLLQPNTPYFWFIRVIDRGTEGRNRTESQWFSFFTGAAGAPLLENPAVLSMTTPPYGPDKGYWIGVMSRNTAPWDVEYLQVRDEFGGVSDWTGRIDYWFTHPCYYSYFSQSDVSIPDGVYTFEMRDWNTHTGTVTRPYVYNPVPPVSENAMVPDPNAYLGTQPLTFSWAPIPGDTPYVYRLRIRDYNQRIVWYDSAWSSETTVTVPEGLNLPRGRSYKWQVMTMDAGGSNLAYTRPRTFTLNAFRFPKPDVKVNGQDGPVLLDPAQPANIEVALDPGDLLGHRVDWWIGVLTTFGTYWLNPSLNWVPSGGPVSVGQYGLFDLSPTSLLSINLPVGMYTFFFILDNNPTGILDEITWYDYVNVFVSPAGIEMISGSISEEAFLEKIQGLME